MNRRDFIVSGAAALAAGCASGSAAGAGDGPKAGAYYAFSRVFQFYDPARASALLRECGYDGVEWTVRKKGHVEPAEAARLLPKAVEAARREGLRADMIVVDFLLPDEPGAMDVLKAAADSGVKAFRPDYFRYTANGSTQEDLTRIRRGFEALAKAAEKTGVKFHYQNHSTYSPKVMLFGSLNWDLWEVLRDFDPKHVGVQYDPMHTMAECGPSWKHSFSLLAPWISTVCLKDFWFEPDGKNPKIWRRHLCPAGEGIVPWKEVKEMIARFGVKAPYSVHYDYAFPEEPKGAAVCAKKDVAYFRSQLG